MKTKSFPGPSAPLHDRTLTRGFGALRNGYPALQEGLPGIGIFGFIAILAIGLSVSSCIYERPCGDEFYRTLWTTDEPGDEPTYESADEAVIEGLTVEFLCDGGVSVKPAAAAGSIGTYSFDGHTATFHNLSLRYGNISIILEEGYRSGDRMTVTWHHADSQEARTVLMHRLSEYP